MNVESIAERAAKYAKQAHESIGQVRKYTNEPYIVHPRAVAEIVASVTDDQNMIAAAWLHDVVEDTPVTLAEITSEFGDDIGRLVDGLTNKSRPEDGNRATRIAMDRRNTSEKDARTKTIKLADLIDNLSGIVAEAPNFAKRYLAEKEQLLAVLKEGHQELWHRVQEIIKSERSKLPNC